MDGIQAKAVFESLLTIQNDGEMIITNGGKVDIKNNNTLDVANGADVTVVQGTLLISGRLQIRGPGSTFNHTGGDVTVGATITK